MSSTFAWVVGNHAVSAVLNTSPERVLEAFVVPARNNATQAELLLQLKQLGIMHQELDKQALSKRSGQERHQGIALRVKPLRERSEKELAVFVKSLSTPFLLILDQVQDPHNFGACLRTADAAGIDAVIVAKDNASPMTPTVQKVASGAAETMPIFRVSNLARSIEQLKGLGVWMIGTSDKATLSLYQQKLDGALALVMGAEGKGLRELTEKKCDMLVKLPMAGAVVSSLNVSVATGICLYEAERQRSIS